MSIDLSSDRTLAGLGWIRSLPEVGEPILRRLLMIEARQVAMRAEVKLLRRERRALLRDIRGLWSDADIASARDMARVSP